MPLLMRQLKRPQAYLSVTSSYLPGLNLYPMLTSVLTSFRLHRVAITADVSKMFREVGLDPGERNFHCFLMRNESGDIADYRMKRLTFNVKSSPSLATVVLLHHADRSPLGPDGFLRGPLLDRSTHRRRSSYDSGATL